MHIKHRYGIPYAFYTEKLRKKADRIHEIEAATPSAYLNQQFRVYYQPKHDSTTGRLIGAEAFVRWIHPRLGTVLPIEFIPIFEQTGFVTHVDAFVWQRTCTNLRCWQDQGLQTVPISVNFSRMDLLDPALRHCLTEAARHCHISPSSLYMEVTESIFSEDIEPVIDTLSYFREQGHLIELDDFGIGYSSLTALSELPIDSLKMDMSFVRQLNMPRKQKVFAACVGLAKNMGLRITAEGIESAEQLETVRRLGVDCVQGYYFSKPLPEDEFEAYLRSCKA